MNSDKDNAEIGMRRGEILIAGPCVSPGYFINPKQPNPELAQKNKEDWVKIQGETFFRSGDVGQILPNGTIQIIDRKKDLWKGPNGEYVALSKVEAALKLCEFVDMPMVYGKTGGSYPVALICPQKTAILRLGAELKLGDDFEVLCKNSEVLARVSKACQDQCKLQKLAAFEIPVRFALISELWTPENDLLTAAMKLKRVIIADKHKAEIAEMYTTPAPLPTSVPNRAPEAPPTALPSSSQAAPLAPPAEAPPAEAQAAQSSGYYPSRSPTQAAQADAAPLPQAGS